MEISIHPYTNQPSVAWEQISRTQRVIKVPVRPPKNQVSDEHLRFVCMSDTHSLTTHIKFDIPHGDVFIHAGDFTRCGHIEEVIDFNNWIGRLPHKHKIVIAGNHELSFDATFTHPFLAIKSTSDSEALWNEIPTLGMSRETLSKAAMTMDVKKELTNCTYLEDSSVTICGIKLYGSPWQPEYCKWAFNLPRGAACLDKWNKIPDDTDVLVTHTPPVGHGDLTVTDTRAGCVELLATVQNRVKPRYHVFGHVHEGYGISSDGKIIFVNASTCDINYLPTNLPVVFDVKLPKGVTKPSF